VKPVCQRCRGEAAYSAVDGAWCGHGRCAHEERRTAPLVESKRDRRARLRRLRDARKLASEKGGAK
jgi:hypothetical protein